MECPHCRLLNPPNAQRCDCGYDFASGLVEQSYVDGSLPPGGVPRRPGGSMALGLAAGFFGGIVGFALVYAFTKSYDTRRGATFGLVAAVAIGVVINVIAYAP